MLCFLRHAASTLSLLQLGRHLQSFLHCSFSFCTMGHDSHQDLQPSPLELVGICVCTAMGACMHAVMANYATTVAGSAHFPQDLCCCNQSPCLCGKTKPDHRASVATFSELHSQTVVTPCNPLHSSMTNSTGNLQGSQHSGGQPPIVILGQG